MEDQDDLDYYAVLNLRRSYVNPQSITSEDIRHAYYNLARVLHPDKQLTSELQDISNQIVYPTLERAYTVLSSPVLRKLYDTYGEEGVEAFERNSNNIEALCTTENDDDHNNILEIVKEILARDARKQWLGGSFSSHSLCRISLQCIDRLSSDWTMSQTSTWSDTSSGNTLTLGSHVVTAHDVLYGALTVEGILNSLHNSTISVSTSAGHSGLKASVGYETLISELTSLTVVSDLSPMALTVSDLTLGLKTREVFHKTSFGSIEFCPTSGIKTMGGIGNNIYGGIDLSRDVVHSCMWIRTKFKNRSTTSSLLPNVINMYASIGISSSPVTIKTTSSFQLTKASKFIYGVTLTSLKSIDTLTFGLRRELLTFEIPIKVSGHVLTSSSLLCTMFFGLVTPVIFAHLKNIVFQKKSISRNDDDDMMIKENEERRLAAISQQELMKPTAEKNVRNAQKKNDGGGLVILTSYVVTNDKRRFDVTIPLQFFTNVGDDKCVISDWTSNQTLGFYKISSNYNSSSSSLYVRYKLGDQVYEVIVKNDRKSITIPNKDARPMGSSSIVL